MSIINKYFLVVIGIEPIIGQGLNLFESPASSTTFHLYNVMLALKRFL